MKLERRKFKYQGYYNSIQGYPVPCECVLEYVEPLEAEELEKRVEELEKENEFLKVSNERLQRDILTDTCPWCGLHGKKECK